MTPRDSLTLILAPVVGAERAAELIDERVRPVLGTSNVLTDKDALALLHSFAADQGPVGAAARLALRRQGATAAPSSGEQVALSAVSSMLEGALGAEKARSVVTETAAQLGIDAETCTRAQAIQVLERLAAMPGIVGVSARFAKARFLLRTA